jgi:hypothetical protein
MESHHFGQLWKPCCTTTSVHANEDTLIGETLVSTIRKYITTQNLLFKGMVPAPGNMAKHGSHP